MSEYSRSNVRVIFSRKEGSCSENIFYKTRKKILPFPSEKNFIAV